MLDLRVYRTAFLPALVAVFVVAFSLQSRPSPVRTRAVADAFDPARAYGSERARDSLLELGAAFPDRRPGSAGDRALADRVAGVFKGSGMEVSRSTSTGRTIDGEADIETVEGIRPGLSPRQIVVLAHRDAASSPGLAELSGTAALIELARVFRTRVSQVEGTEEPGRPQLIGRDLRRTLVLVSTSGGSGGAAGAREWARNADPSLIDGVLVLGDIASAKSRKPWVVPWSNGRDQPPIGFVRTVELAARAESAEDPGRQRATAQWARRALPFTVSEQGEVDRAGLPGALLQASGELGPAPGAATLPRTLHRPRPRRAADRHRDRRGRPRAAGTPRCGRSGRASPRASSPCATWSRTGASGSWSSASSPPRCSRRSTRSSASAAGAWPPARGSAGRSRPARPCRSPGRGCACSASPARSPRRAPRWRRACSSSPAGRSPRWPRSRSRSWPGS